MMRKNGGLSDKWLYIPILILGAYFIIRLFDQLKIIHVFPLDYTNDISSYMAMLYFLGKYGYHAIVPNWYNGLQILLFDIYPPGWFFMAYPIYLITKSVQVAAYASLMLNYTLGIAIFYWIGKIIRLSRAQYVAFFLLYFASPMGIGDFIRQMRLPEMTAWIIFICMFALLLYFKEKALNWKFWGLIIGYAALIITHPPEAVLFTCLLIGFFFIRQGIKEKAYVVTAILGGLALSSPWWIFFLKRLALTNATGIMIGISDQLSSFSISYITGIANIILPIFLIIALLFYLWSKGFNLKETIFFSPLPILSLLFLTSLNRVVPLLNMVYNDVKLQFYAFFILFFIFAADYKKVTGKSKRYLEIGLAFASIAFVIISVFHTPWFIEPGVLGEELHSVLKEINGTYIMLNPFPNSIYGNAVVSYTAIYLNLNSSQGWVDLQQSQQHITRLNDAQLAFMKRDCKEVTRILTELNDTEMLLYGEGCQTAAYCKWQPKVIKTNFCLYLVDYENGSMQPVQ